MKSKLLLLSFFLFNMVHLQRGLAQSTIRIHGKVISSDERTGIPGVSVKLKGMNAAVQTDLQGNYSIVVPSSQSILVFSSVGFVTQERVVGNQSTLNVVLETKEVGLNEVVVLGYGQSKKRDLTGSVSTVKIDELQKAPVRSFEEALAGRVAGVTASADDGQPGSSVNIVIRGNNSLTQDNSPLYVIDGFPVENPDNNAINPAEIQSIEVLKDASSTAIYGARGANGVIIITTKKGKEGKAVITYNTYYGFQQNNRKIDLMSPYDYVKYQLDRDSLRTDSTYLGNGQTLEDFRNISGTNLQNELLGTRPYFNHFLSISGGSKGTKYSISSSAFNQNGIIVNSGYNRYQGRVRLDQDVNNWLDVGVNTNYSHMKQFGTSPTRDGSGSYYGNLLFSVWAFRPVSGKINEPTDIENDDEDFLVLNGFNPIKTAKNQLRNNISDILTTNAYADFKLSKAFKLRVTGSLTKNKVRRESFNNSLTPQGSPLTQSGKDNGVNGSLINDEISSWANENTLTYIHDINKSNSINAVVGFTMSGANSSSFGAAANLIPDEDLGISGIDEGQPVSIRSTSTLYTLASFLGRVNYTFHSKYLFTASFRADGSSKFSPQNRWSYFPSGAFAWRLSDENFMKSLTFISNAKIRMSYGVTGNNRVSDFAYLSRISIPSGSGYSFNNQPVSASYLASLGNLNLKWESTAQADAGLDLGFLNERISLEMDVYKKTTSNLLLNASVPGSIGFNTALKNIGKVQNQGLEFTLNTVNIEYKNFSWNSNFNISFNRNKVLELSDGETQRLTTAPWNNLTSSVPLFIAEVGAPIARFYGYIWDGNYQYSDFDKSTSGVYTLKQGVAGYGNVSSIQPGDIKFKDINGDGVVDEGDRTIIGNPNPDFTGGFSNNFRFKNFDLNVFLNFSVGNDVLNANRYIFEGGGYNNGQNMYATYANRWTPDNQNNEYFRSGGGGPADFAYSTRIVENGSYLKLKTVQLGYNFPLKMISKLKLSALRLYVSGQNLHTWTKYQGFDPEVSRFGSSALMPGFDFSVYPYAKTITFGLNVSL